VVIETNMPELKIYNSLSRSKEIFESIKPGKAGMYTCGPTVYDNVTIGNWRTYILSDLVHRTLKYNGYDVDFVMNITDVGHLTGDNEGDASSGEDRMEKASKREGKTAFEISEFYTKSFLEGYDDLNIIKPKIFAKATDHIQEQIDLIKKIEERGFTYQTSDGIYFDTQAYEKAGHKYGELSSLEEIQEGARVAVNPEKKNPRDFALWKFNPTVGEREMEWESPWGVGFPGWHIECSAMSMKYLGEQFDVHAGGEDLLSTHHPNEIAQSEAACDCSPFVKYWIHGAHLMVDNGRMGKSMGNAYTLADIKERRLSPLALRYLYLGGYYRKQQNFTWEALEAAHNGLKNLQNYFIGFGEVDGEINERYKEKFLKELNDDFGVSSALAVVWNMVKDENLSPADKRITLLDFDIVLGLDLKNLMTKASNATESIPENIKRLVEERETARKNKDWGEADRLRTEIEDLGFEIKDSEHGPVVLEG